MKKKLIRFLAGAAVFVAALIAERVGLEFWVYFSGYITAYLIFSCDVLFWAGKGIIKGRVLDEAFLMSAASIGALCIGEYPEAVAVMLLNFVGEFFQDRALRGAKKSIAELMDIRADYANLKRGTDIERVSPESVAVGDLIIVKAGEKIPLDGRVTEGESFVDTRALTGESTERRAAAGDGVFAGFVNKSGLLTVEVTKTFENSAAAKIAAFTEQAAEKKAPAEKFITKFAKIYTPAVVAAAVLLAVMPTLIYGNFSVYLHRALSFLVISCPCALVISVPLCFFTGLGAASRRGVLVKGGEYLEALNKADTFVFDKTGTLTEGVFAVREVLPAQGFTRGELLKYAACAEAYSNHPLAACILSEYGEPVGKEISDYQELAGRGVTALVSGRRVAAGNAKLMEDEGVKFDISGAGGTKVYVSADGVFAGVITAGDRIKAEARETLSALSRDGVKKIIMLTGDNYGAGALAAAELGLDFRAELLPHEKAEEVERLIKEKDKTKTLIFVGDGINDAPSLALADVGIAMGALGSDAAVEAADIVLTGDSLAGITAAKKIAKKTRKKALVNIIFALAVKTAVLALNFFGITSMWQAVFADVGVSLLCVLNALRWESRGK